MFGSSKAASNRPTSTIDTLVGAKTKIKGDITFSGGFRVDGSVVGSIVSDGAQDAVLTISDQGSVEGEVRAPHVIINGTMKGDVMASERVELAAQARVVGNVHYKVLEMAAGAQITGCAKTSRASSCRNLMPNRTRRPILHQQWSLKPTNPQWRPRSNPRNVPRSMPSAVEMARAAAMLYRPSARRPSEESA